MIFADAKLADFPERLDPMTVKELRQGLRARKFVIPFICVHVAMLVACAYEYILMSEQLNAAMAGATSSSGSGPFGISSDDWSEYGLWFWIVAYVMLLVVMPATRFFDIQQEYDGRNAELLLLSGLSRWRIVRGKWIMCVALSMLIFVSIIPYLLLRYFISGIELTQHFLIAAGLVLNNAVFTAMIIGASAYRNYLSRISLILAAMLVLGVTMIVPLVVVVGMLNEAGSNLWIVLMLLCNQVACAIFYSILGLQLARVKLRTFEDPYDPSPGSQVVILYLFAPLLIGIPALFTLGLGGIVAALFFTWIALNIDPPPKKGRRADYAQL